MTGDTPRTARETAGIAVQLLGGLELTGYDGNLELPHDAGRVVAFLALQDGPVPRAYVAGTLWMDGSQDRAFGNLRSALWRLRRLTTRLVVADGSDLDLASGVTTDIERLRSTAERLARPASSEVSWPAADHIDPTWLALELLPGWYEEWAVVERERLRQLSLYALESLAERLADAGEHGRAIQAAFAAIRLDPLRESTHRCLISIHIGAGNYSEALRDRKSVV